MLFKHLFLSTFLCISITAQAASVWKVSKDNKELYIGGTIHLLSQQDYPLPKEFDQAYAKSEVLVFETDIGAMESPEFQVKAMQVMTYPGTKTIKDVLSKPTLDALQAHLQTRGIPLEQMAKLKPGMLSVTLSLIEFQVIGLTSAGVDKHYSDLARNDNKTQNWLESLDQQLEFLAKMGEGEEDSLIQYTLRDIKILPEMIAKIKTYWRDGDMKAMTDLSITPFKKDYPQVYSDLIVKRNLNWLPQIENMFKNDIVEFVLVGALHLAGDDSVLTMLENKGYKIEKI